MSESNLLRKIAALERRVVVLEEAMGTPKIFKLFSPPFLKMITAMGFRISSCGSMYYLNLEKIMRELSIRSYAGSVAIKGIEYYCDKNPVTLFEEQIDETSDIKQFVQRLKDACPHS